MPYLAICWDIESGAARLDLMQSHAAHIMKHLGHFLFTGPIADADGVNGAGDDPQLKGSVYCLDILEFEETKRVMEADPFSRGVWRQIDYYQWEVSEGIWRDVAARPEGPGLSKRYYLAAFSMSVALADSLMSGELTYLGSTGPAARHLRAMALLDAASIGEASARARGADWVAAVPVAIGRWVGVSTMAQLAELRGA